MKLYHAGIYLVEEGEGHGRSPKLLCSSFDLTSFGFFQQTSVREFMKFSGKMLAEKTESGRHLSVQEENYVCHVSSGDITGILISDSEYPARVALSIVNRDPSAADALLKLQNDVDETKHVMFCNLDSLLKRDEKLDDLVAQSEELSLAAKAFYVTAKKTNKCCSIL